MTDIDDEEDEETPPSPRRMSPEWLRDTYSASFRAVPPVHSGARSVRDEDTIGSLELCWCGEPFDHDWPGKAQRRKHPKGSNVQQTAASLDRNSLRAYDSAIQDFILHEIRVNDLKYRLQNNAVLLYPPDGSQPITVYARKNDKQLRSLASWHQKHVEEFLHPKEEVDVAKVAAVLNDPVEHPARPTLVEQATPVPVPEVVEKDDLDGEWVTYFGTKGDPIEGMVTDGSKVKCTICADTDHPWEGTVLGVGGHRRTWHSADSEEYRRAAKAGGAVRAKPRPFTPEDYVKSGQARSIKAKQMKATRVAVQALCDALDWYPNNPAAPKIDGKPVDMDAEARLLALSEERDVAVKRAEDAEAKVALLKETLGL